MNPRSDFYIARRQAIENMIAWSGFMAGLVVAVPMAWRAMQGKMDSESFERAVLSFAGTELLAAIAGGIVGYLIGVAVAVVWERWHRWRRG